MYHNKESFQLVKALFIMPNRLYVRTIANKNNPKWKESQSFCLYLEVQTSMFVVRHR